jgi:hypothetical protein
MTRFFASVLCLLVCSAPALAESITIKVAAGVINHIECSGTFDALKLVNIEVEAYIGNAWTRIGFVTKFTKTTWESVTDDIGPGTYKIRAKLIYIDAGGKTKSVYSNEVPDVVVPGDEAGSPEDLVSNRALAVYSPGSSTRQIVQGAGNVHWRDCETEPTANPADSLRSKSLSHGGFLCGAASLCWSCWWSSALSAF